MMLIYAPELQDCRSSLSSS